MHTEQLYETDRVDWTPDTLRSAIAEDERLLAKLRPHLSDAEMRRLETLLEEDLRNKRRLLATITTSALLRGRR